jgi:tetratricopeptide (TPR) repeat protein
MTHKSDLKKRIRARQAKTGESYTTARMHVLRARDELVDDKSSEVERVIAVVLKCNEKSLRVRVLGEDGEVTLRCSSSEAVYIAPAQLVEVKLGKRWAFHGDAYMSGTIERNWTDVGALDLEPLELEDLGLDDLREIYEGPDLHDPYFDSWSSLTATKRRAGEFDGVAWGAGVGVEDEDTYLVSDAAEVSDHDPLYARDLLMKVLHADLRCIDAHVHLGNLCFEHWPKQAMVHYQIAVAIGELSLGDDFGGYLPWGCIYNRPFLRALHSLGLCLWRIGEVEQAEAIFERLLMLNPSDNPGVRFCLADVQEGRPWSREGGLNGATLG